MRRTHDETPGGLGACSGAWARACDCPEGVVRERSLAKPRGLILCRTLPDRPPNAQHWIALAQPHAPLEQQVHTRERRGLLTLVKDDRTACKLVHLHQRRERARRIGQYASEEPHPRHEPGHHPRAHLGTQLDGAELG